MQSSPSSLKRIIQAGAGAGKTTELVSTFVNFAQDFKTQHHRYPKVIICTFTRKATFELKERLQQKCLEIGDTALLEHLVKKSEIHISTIHGVCSLFLQRHGDALGFDPLLRIVSEDDKLKEWRKLLRNTLKSNPEFLDLLNDFRFKDLLKIAQLHTRHLFLNPQLRYWSGKDFQDWSIQKMKSYVSQTIDLRNQLLHYQLRPPWQKFLVYMNSFPNELSVSLENIEACLEVCRNFFHSIPNKPTFSKDKDPFPPEFVDEWKTWWKDFSSFLDSPLFESSFLAAWEKQQSTLNKFLSEISQKSFQVNLESSQLTFSELEEYALYLASEFPDSSLAFSKHWDFWMIDEYQDTSPTQEKILQLLIREKSEFIVGDPQQSIYLFRNADSRLFGKKIHQFKNQGGEFKQKVINYRSNHELVSFFNEVFCTGDAHFMEMETAPDKPVHFSSTIPSVEFLLGDQESPEQGHHLIKQKIYSLLENGAKLSEIAILARTGDLLRDAAQFLTQAGLPVQVHNQTVFFERREIIEALSFVQFLLNPHDNIQFLTLLRTPWIGASDQLIHDLIQEKNSDPAEKPKSYWLKFKSIEKSSSLADCRHLIAQLTSYLELSKIRGVSRTLLYFLKESHFLKLSEFRDDSGQVESNLFKLVDLLEQFERAGTGHYFELLDRLNNSKDSDPESSDATPLLSSDRLNLMTIHSSKGLQFPHVILLGLHKKLNEPKRQDYMVDHHKGLYATALLVPAGDDEDENDKKIYAPFCSEFTSEKKQQESLEQKRIFYVGVTRAQQTITLCWNEASKTKDTQLKGMNQYLKSFSNETGDHEKACFRYTVRRWSEDKSFEDKKPSLSHKKISHETLKPLSLKVEQTEDVSNVTRISAGEAPKTSLNSSTLRSRARFGIRVHRLLESMKNVSTLQEHHFDFSSLLKEFEIQKVIQLDPLEKNYIQYLFEQSQIPFVEILKNGFPEWGFQVSVNQRIVRGQIDLWGKVGNTVWVIDYKTGSSSQLEKAKIQLAVYKQALLQINPSFKNENVVCAAVFLHEKLIHIIKNEPEI